MLKLVAALLVIGLACCAAALAENEEREQLLAQLEAMGELLLRDPGAASTELEAIAERVDRNDSALYLLYLLRCAEADKYSYRFASFEANIGSALELVNERTPARLQAALLIHDGVVKQTNGDYRESVAALERAARIARQAGDVFAHIFALIELAYTRGMQEEYELALNEMQQAYLQASKSGNKFLVGAAEEIYGSIYVYDDKPKESVHHYEKALRIYEELNYPYYVAEATYGIATTYRWWERWDEAIDWYQRFRDVSRPIASDGSEFYLNYGLGMTYAQKGECANSMPWIDAALAAAGYKDYKAELYKRLALCRAGAGDFDAAEESIAQARAMFDAMPSMLGTSWALEVDKVAARVAAMKGEFQTAYLTLDSYYEAFLAANEKNSSKQLEELKLNLQVERERQELETLANEAQLQELRLNSQMRKNDIQQMWLLGAILLVLLVTGLAIWQQRVSRLLKSLSVTDELTGLMNRRFVFAEINRLLANKSVASMHAALMLIDLDNLKSINDKHGHRDGDKAIKLVADVGNDVLRYGDVFARIGGDEFMLLLTRLDHDQQQVVANRIVKGLSESILLTDGGEELSVSVSIGIVSIDETGLTAETLYARADEAMYRAKSLGRNCICQWQ